MKEEYNVRAEKLAVLIPAHNEQDNIEATIRAIQEQTVPPTHIYVIDDNSTDNTGLLAASMGVFVITTTDNSDRKAGALNQALLSVLGEDYDYIMVCDADTIPVPTLIANALYRLRHNPELGAVGAVFTGEAQSLLEKLQVNEWSRYASQLQRTGKTWVLSGTAAVIRAEALREVAASRGRTLPGETGKHYLPEAATEDMELTVALRTLGWQVQSPIACKTTTELMPNLRMLYKQRLRWYGGAIQTIRNYGMTFASQRYWFQQVLLGLGVVAFNLYIALTVIGSLTGTIAFSIFWMLIGGVFILENFVTATYKGVALVFIIELLYALFLQYVWIIALIKNIRGKRIAWEHL